ncbi:18534_t:CDS:2, partial [Dentiscutata erythropus]
IDQEIINTKNDVSIFENHADDFFEYVVRQTQFTEKDLLCEVKQYLGRIIDDSHASLDANMIAALMCQRNWLDAAKKFGWKL